MDVSGHPGQPEPSWFGLVSFLGGVEGEGSQDFAGGGIDDADVEVVDEDGSGVGSADADVAEAAVVAERDVAGFVDAVVPDAVVVVATQSQLGTV
jgi:hypothetical protein